MAVSWAKYLLSVILFKIALQIYHSVNKVIIQVNLLRDFSRFDAPKRT